MVGTVTTRGTGEGVRGSETEEGHRSSDHQDQDDLADSAIVYMTLSMGKQTHLDAAIKQM